MPKCTFGIVFYINGKKEKNLWNYSWNNSILQQKQNSIKYLYFGWKWLRTWNNKRMIYSLVLFGQKCTFIAHLFIILELSNL